MYPWRRILIPTDFSTASEWVFDDAVRIAGSTGGEVVILHIRMTYSTNPNELRFPADTSIYDYAERVELEKLRDRVKRSNATVPARLVVKTAPDPALEICRTAKEEEIDLVIMATHARHHVTHILVGGVTQKVISTSCAPTLAIRYGIRKRRAFRRLIVPVHLKQTSQAALTLAASICQRERGQVDLITVCPDSDRSAAEALLADLAASQLKDVATARTIVTGTDVQREVIRYSERTDADAIFLNSADSPSELKLDIIRHASVPVMIVPV